ncbi:hypothetical protein AAUPMC_13960 [Pasteurella multocida subsp. multocida str. Anand1_cattle]|nr:hypothetical protein AAUPMC_13960 [Pasteurella multocida subsp. multocida str. Anand1_cattle]
MIKVRSDFTNFVKVDRTSISENLKIWFYIAIHIGKSKLANFLK